jgi:pSer/pThr/pTyr-binding forkhead associated (FHA) protein
MKKQQTALKLINEAEMIGAPALTHFNKHYTSVGATHDYNSIWFDSTAIFFISQYNLRVSKIKNHYFISSYFK